MEIPEYHRHRIHLQFIKLIGRLRESRHEINLCDTNIKIIQNADRIPDLATLQLKTTEIVARIDAIHNQIESTIVFLVEQADILHQAMDNPNHKSPPLFGRHIPLENLTQRQRMLIREGHMPHSDIPTHETIRPEVIPEKQPAPLPKVLVIKRKRRKPRGDMPI